MKRQNRLSMLGMEKALHSVFNAKDSALGITLLRTNKKEERLLETELNKLEKQIKKQSVHLNQEKNTFLTKKQQEPEPILLIEHPRTPSIRKRPHYMKPTERQKTPSNLRTIDMVVRKTSRKANVWQSGEIKFETLSTAVLTNKEKEKLEENYRPRFIPTPSRPASKATSISTDSLPSNIKRLLKSTGRVPSATFITEIEDIEDIPQRPKTPKSVKFRTERIKKLQSIDGIKRTDANFNR